MAKSKTKPTQKLSDRLKNQKNIRSDPNFQRHYEAVKDTAAHYMPYTANTITNFNRTISDINNWVKTSTPFRKSPQGTSEEKRIYRFATSMFEAAKADLKEGNLLTFKNINAKLGELVGGMGDQEFDEEYDAEYDSDDEYSSSSFGGFDAEMYMEGTAITAQATVDAVSSATDIITHTQLEAADYTSKRIVSGTNIAISHVLKYQAANADILNAMNNNISTLVETVNRQDAFQSEATRFYDTTTQKLDDIIELMRISADPAKYRMEQREAREYKRLNENDFLTSGFDPGKYAKHVWEKSSLGMVGQMGLATIEPFLGLLGFDVSALTKQFGGMGPGRFRPVQALFEKTPLYRTINSLNEQTENVWKTMFHRLSADAANFSKDPEVNGIISLLSQFGLFDAKLVKTRGISLGSYDKESQLPTGVTMKAIEIVIPQYLSNIENDIATLVEGFTTGQFMIGTFNTQKHAKFSDEQREANRKYFEELRSGNLKNRYSYEDGEFIKLADLKQELQDTLDDMLMGSLSGVVDNITSSMRFSDEDDAKKFGKEVTKIISKIATSRDLGASGYRDKFRELLIKHIDKSKFADRESAHSAIDVMLENTLLAGANYQRSVTDFNKNVSKGKSKYESLYNQRSSEYINNNLETINEKRTSNARYDSSPEAVYIDLDGNVVDERYVDKFSNEYVARNLKGKVHAKDANGKDVNYFNFNRSAQDAFKDYEDRITKEHERDEESVTDIQIKDFKELRDALIDFIGDPGEGRQADQTKKKNYEKLRKAYIKKYGDAPTDFLESEFTGLFNKSGKLNMSLPGGLRDKINLPTGHFLQYGMNFIRNLMVWGEIEDTWNAIDNEDWGDSDTDEGGSGGSGGSGNGSGSRSSSLRQAARDSVNQFREDLPQIGADIRQGLEEYIQDKRDTISRMSNTIQQRAQLTVNEAATRFLGETEPALRQRAQDAAANISNVTHPVIAGITTTLNGMRVQSFDTTGNTPSPTSQTEQTETEAATEGNVNSASLNEEYDASNEGNNEERGIREKEFETEGATVRGQQDDEDSAERPMKNKGMNVNEFVNDRVNKAKTWTNQKKSLMVEIATNIRRFLGYTQDSHIRLFGPGGIFSSTIVKFMENFKTVENFLFGEKDENGYYKGGLIAPTVANKLVDTRKAAQNKLFGTEYTDYAGNYHAANEDYLMKGVEGAIEDTREGLWTSIAGEDYRNSDAYNSSLANMFRHKEDRIIRIHIDGDTQFDENGVAIDNYIYKPNPLPHSKVVVIGWRWSADDGIWQFIYNYGDKKNQVRYPDPQEFDWKILKDPAVLPTPPATEVLVNELNRMPPPEVANATISPDESQTPDGEHVTPQSTMQGGKSAKDLFGFDWSQENVERDTKRNLVSSVFLNSNFADNANVSDQLRELFEKEGTAEFFDQLMNSNTSEEDTKNILSLWMNNNNFANVTSEKVEAVTQRIMTLRQQLEGVDLNGMQVGDAAMLVNEYRRNMGCYYYEVDVNGSPVMYRGYLNVDGNAIANSASPLPLTFYSRTTFGNKIEDTFMNNETMKFEKYVSTDGGHSFKPVKEEKPEGEAEGGEGQKPENLKRLSYEDLTDEQKQNIKYSVTDVNGKAVLSGKITDEDGQSYFVDMSDLELLKSGTIDDNGQLVRMDSFGKYLRDEHGNFIRGKNNQKLLDRGKLVNAAFALNEDGERGEYLGKEVQGIHSVEELQQAIDERRATEIEANNEVKKQTNGFLKTLGKGFKTASTIFGATLGMVLGGPIGIVIGAGIGSGTLLKPIFKLHKSLFGDYKKDESNTKIGGIVHKFSTVTKWILNKVTTIFTTTVGFMLGGPVGAGIGFALGAGSFKRGGLFTRIFGGKHENGKKTKGLLGTLLGGVFSILFGTKVEVDDVDKNGKAKIKKVRKGGLLPTLFGIGSNVGKSIKDHTQDSGILAPALGSLFGLATLGLPGLFIGNLGGRLIGHVGNTVKNKVKPSEGKGPDDATNSASYQDYNESEGYGLLDRVKGAVSKPFNAVRNVVSKPFGKAKSKLSGALGNAQSYLSGVFGIENEIEADEVIADVVTSSTFCDAIANQANMLDATNNQTDALSEVIKVSIDTNTSRILDYLRESDRKEETREAKKVKLRLIHKKSKEEDAQNNWATALTAAAKPKDEDDSEGAKNSASLQPPQSDEEGPNALSTASSLASKINKMTTNTATGLRGLVNGFTNFISIGLGAAASMLFGPEVGPIVQLVAGTAGRALTTAIPIVGGLVIGGSFIAKFLDTPLGKQLKANITSLFEDHIKPWWDNTGSKWVQARFDDAKNTIETYWPKVEDWLGKQAEKLGNKMMDAIDAIPWEKLGEKLVEGILYMLSPFDKEGHRKTSVVDVFMGNRVQRNYDENGNYTGSTTTHSKAADALGTVVSTVNPTAGSAINVVNDIGNIAALSETKSKLGTKVAFGIDVISAYTNAKKKEDQYQNQSVEDMSVENEGTGSVGYGRLDGEHYAQGDKRWKSLSFGTMNNGTGTTIGTGGCGPTALATVARALTGNKTITPSTVANMAQDYGYTANGGSSASLFTEGANRLGLSSRRIRTRDIASQLASGRRVIVSGRKKGTGSPYTNAGHIISIRGLQNGKAVVDDPLKNTSETMPIGNVLKGARKAWAIGTGNVGYGNIRDYGYSNEGYGWLYKDKVMEYDTPLTYADNPDLVLANPYDLDFGGTAMFYLQYPFPRNSKIYSAKKSEKLWMDEPINWLKTTGGTFYGGCIPTAFANIMASVSGVDIDPLTLTRLYGFPSGYDWKHYGDMYYLLTGKGSAEGDPAAWATNLYDSNGGISGYQESYGNNPIATGLTSRSKEEAKQYNEEVYQKMITSLSSGGGVFIDTHSAPKIANGADYSDDGHGFALYGWNPDSQTFYTLDPGRSNGSYQVTKHTLDELHDDIMNGRIRNAEGFPKGDEHVADRLKRKMRDYVSRYFPDLFVNGQIMSTKNGLPYSGYDSDGKLTTFVQKYDGTISNVNLNPTGVQGANSSTATTSGINYDTDPRFNGQASTAMTANDYGGYKYADQLNLNDTTLFGKIGNMMTILAGIAGNMFKSLGGDPYESVFGYHSGSSSSYYGISDPNRSAVTDHVAKYIRIEDTLNNDGYSYVDIGGLDLSDDAVLTQVAKDAVDQLLKKGSANSNKIVTGAQYEKYVNEYKAKILSAYNNKEYVDGKYYQFTMPGADDSILIPAWYHKDNVIRILGQKYPYSVYEEYMKGKSEEANQKKYQDFLEESYDKYALGIARNANGTQNIGMSLYTYDGKPASSKTSADIAAEISGSGSDLIVPTIIASQYLDAYNTPISSDMGFDVVVPNGLPAQYANTGLPTSAVSEKNPSWSAEPSYKFRGDTARSMLQNSYGITNISNNPKDYAAEEPISAEIFVKNTNCGTQPPGTLFRDFRKFPPITADKMNQLIDDISSKGTPLKGMGQDFVDASNMSGIDPRVLVAWAQAESGSGTHAGISTKKGNLYGIGAVFGNAQNAAWNFAGPDGTINWRSAVLRQAEYLSRNWVNRHDGSFDPLACPALLGWSSWHKYGTGYDFDGETPPAEGSAMYMTSYGNTLANIVKRTEGYGEAEGYGDLDMPGLANMANMKDEFDITDNPNMTRMIGEGFGRINANNNNTHRSALSISESREYAPVIKSDSHATTHISVDNPVELDKIESSAFKMVSLLEAIVRNTAQRQSNTTINNHINNDYSTKNEGYGQGNKGTVRNETVAVTDPQINNNYHDRMHRIHDTIAKTPRSYH